MRGGGFYYGELLRLAMKNYTAQRRLWLPSLLRLKLGARRFGLFGLFIVFILSGPAGDTVDDRHRHGNQKKGMRP